MSQKIKIKNGPITKLNKKKVRHRKKRFRKEKEEDFIIKKEKDIQNRKILKVIFHSHMKKIKKYLIWF